MVRHALGICVLAFGVVPASAQVTMTRWDFNAPGLSATSPAATFANQGVGIAMMIGGTGPVPTGVFLADTGSSDSVAGSAWSISNFPAQGLNSGRPVFSFGHLQRGMRRCRSRWTLARPDASRISTGSSTRLIRGNRGSRSRRRPCNCRVILTRRRRCGRAMSGRARLRLCFLRRRTGFPNVAFGL